MKTHILKQEILQKYFDKDS